MAVVREVRSRRPGRQMVYRDIYDLGYRVGEYIFARKIDWRYCARVFEVTCREYEYFACTRLVIDRTGL